MKYLHSASILHRDIKPGNLLVNSDCVLKICDFGLARVEEPDEDVAMTQEVVTQYYRAPELLMGARHYGQAVDIWSVGCIFAELLGRRILFQAQTPIQQLDMITDLLGTPSAEEMKHACEGARLHMRRNGHKPPALTALYTLSPQATHEAVYLLSQMLVFDPVCFHESSRCRIKKKNMSKINPAIGPYLYTKPTNNSATNFWKRGKGFFLCTYYSRTYTKVLFSISCAEALRHPYLDEGRLRYHSCMCKCCHPTTCGGRQYTDDFEPVAPQHFDSSWEKELTTTQVVKERMHKYVLDRLNNGRVPLCINPQSAAFKSFASSTVAQPSELPPSPHHWE
ncbi:unnamed protein product [Notodromas monacha]|uniref:Protein kinase domain-containing protein n=1 Tax=Notodromas monacha TaxID=399045 RepID=A0A7R9GID1_9CRUS|nr:unnamed protein product [Notodromas monacha]CAG0922474.1 unnamed protein product [Notodromas monacha]